MTTTEERTTNVRELSSAAEREGLLVHVLRNALGDCTAGGVTSTHDSFILVGEHVPPYARIFHPDDRTPALRIVKRTTRGELYFHAEPLDPPPPGTTGWMAGGNFVHTSDGRWRDIVGHSYPIAVHDRAERPLFAGGV